MLICSELFLPFGSLISLTMDIVFESRCCVLPFAFPSFYLSLFVHHVLDHRELCMHHFLILVELIVPFFFNFDDIHIYHFLLVDLIKAFIPDYIIDRF